MKLSHALLYATAASAALIAAAPAAAQAPVGQAAIEEVVVTAQRREERLQDIPVAVTAFGEKRLSELGVVNIKNITAYTPNVELTTSSRPTAGGAAYAAFIRGVGNGDYAFPTDPAIGLYVDGVYLARPLGGLLSIADIERVEVLRGPQGTLYGRNTLGGAISVATKRPIINGPAEGGFLVRAGSYGRLDATAEVTAPLVEDKIGGKLSVATFNSNGFGRRALTGERTNDEGRVVVRTGLLFNLAEDLKLDVRADYSRQRQTGNLSNYSSAYATPPALVARFNQFAAAAQNARFGLPANARYGSAYASSDLYVTNSLSPLQDDFDQAGIAATFDYSPSKAFNFRSITGYRDLATHIQVDGDASPYEVSTTNEKFRDSTFSQEFQASGELFGDRLRYLVGLYYFREKGRNFKYSYSFHGVYEATGIASDARDTYTFQDYEATSYAIFTQNELKLTDRLTLVAGGRLNYDEKDFSVLVTLPQRGGVVSVPQQSKRQDWTSFTPRLGLNWKPTDDILLYGSYSKGFKSGGFGAPTAAYSAPVYDPEELSAYEAGAKTEWFDGRLVANFAAFWSRWKDIQLSVIVPGPTGGVVNTTQNGGTAELYGWEAELRAMPVSGLSFDFGVGYTHHELTELTPGAASAGFRLDTKLPHVPKWTVNPAVQYDFSTAVGDVSLRLSASYRSDQFLTINDPSSFQKDYTIVNARAAFTPAAYPDLELALEGFNLTKARYLTYNQNASIFGIQLNVPGDPRFVNVTARYRF